MNSKRNSKCHLLNDWKEQIVHIGDEQVSLQNKFDNLRNDFSDNSPRLNALETGLNSLDGRVIITETDIISNTDRITANENDIDRIDTELVNKTGDINALANRVTLAEGDIDDIDARLVGIETGSILYSQLTMDADKDFEGKAIINPGNVDGVDVGSHVHSGAAGSGAKINLKDVEVTEDKDFGGKAIVNPGLVDGMDVSEHVHDGTAIGGKKINLSDINIDTTLRMNYRSISEINQLYFKDDIDTNLNMKKSGDSLQISNYNNTLSINPASIGQNTEFNGGALNFLFNKNINAPSINNCVIDGTGVDARFEPNRSSGNAQSTVLSAYSADGTKRAILLTENAIRPGTTSTGLIDLGSDVTKFRDLKISRNADIGGAITGASVSASGAITQNNGMPVLSIIPTAPSDNVRYSHDAEASTIVTGSTNKVLLKKFTFSHYAPTLARVKYDVRGTSGTSAYTEVRKNGVLIGERYTQPGADYVTKRQDLNIDIKPGDTIELWGSTSSTAGDCRVRNFRVCFDAGVPAGVTIS